MIVYADTSALVKAILDEEGTPEILAMMEVAEAVVSAAIAYVEIRAALAAAIRAGRIPPSLRDATMREVERLWAGLAQVQIDDGLLRAAADAAERHALRGYDAVHLAALQETGPPGPVAFACWDTDLRRAASRLGYELIPESLQGASAL